MHEAFFSNDASQDWLCNVCDRATIERVSTHGRMRRSYERQLELQ